VVADPTNRGQIQVDVAVVHPGDGGRRPAVSLIGETKWGTVMGAGHIDRLARARELLAGAGRDVSCCRLACFSAAGFADSLRRRAAEDPDIALVGLDELYGVSWP
jgi:hypothetical protein